MLLQEDIQRRRLIPSKQSHFESLLTISGGIRIHFLWVACKTGQTCPYDIVDRDVLMPPTHPGSVAAALQRRRQAFPWGSGFLPSSIHRIHNFWVAYKPNTKQLPTSSQTSHRSWSSQLDAGWAAMQKLSHLSKMVCSKEGVGRVFRCVQ